MIAPTIRRCLAIAGVLALSITSGEAETIAQFAVNRDDPELKDRVGQSGITVSHIVRSIELLSETDSKLPADQWLSKRWPTGDARSSDDYLSFTMSSNQRFVNLDFMQFTIVRLNADDPEKVGPRHWELRCSLDNFTNHDQLIQAYQFSPEEKTGTIVVDNESLQAVPMLRPGGSLRFRLYAFGSGGPDAYGGLAESLTVDGSPQSIVAMFQPVDSQFDLPDLAGVDGLSVTPMTRNATATRGFGGWIQRGWPNGPQFSSARLETTIEAIGAAVEFETASYVLRRASGTTSNSGPADWEFRYSINGGPESVLRSSSVAWPDGGTTLTETDVSLAGLPILAPGDVLALRWYGTTSSGANDPGGFDLSAPVVITGKVSGRALARFIPRPTRGTLEDVADAPGVTVSNLRALPGVFLITHSQDNAGYLARGWPGGDFIAEDAGFTTSITIDEGPVFLTQARFNLFRINNSTTNGGPAEWEFRYSIDDGPITHLETISFPWPFGGPLSSEILVPLSGPGSANLPFLQEGSTITFYWYGHISGSNSQDEGGFAAGTNVVIYGYEPSDSVGVLPTPFRLWQMDQFPLQSGNPVTRAAIWGRHADPDGDGKSNLYEYLFRCDPNRGDHSALRPHRFNGVFSFNTDVVDDLQFQLHADFSGDFSGNGVDEVIGTEQSSVPGRRTLRFADPGSNSATARRFGRLFGTYPY